MSTLTNNKKEKFLIYLVKNSVGDIKKKKLLC